MKDEVGEVSDLFFLNSIWAARIKVMNKGNVRVQINNKVRVQTIKAGKEYLLDTK